MHNGAAFKLFQERVKKTIKLAIADKALTVSARHLQLSLNRLVEVTHQLLMVDDVNLTLANASIYLEVFGHITIAWIWLEQLLATVGKQGDFYEGKRAAAQYFYKWELPKTDVQLNLLVNLDRTALDMKNIYF